MYAQHEIEVPQNVFLRKQTSLNGYWQYFVDRYEPFFYNFVREPFDDTDPQWRLDFVALDGRARDKTERYEYSFDGADSLGILPWEEIPVYWTIDWNNPATYAVAEQHYANWFDATTTGPASSSGLWPTKRPIRPSVWSS